MADVRRIKIDNTIYNIKDNTARSNITSIKKAIAVASESATTSAASAARSVGDYVWLGSDLYIITQAIASGGSYTVNTNCKKISLDNIMCITTPEEFGAVGDGVANDTAALQACIDCANGQGKIVYLAQTYYITDSIDLYNNIHITGSGSIKNIGGHVAAITSLNCENVSNVLIENIKFINGNRDLQAHSQLSANIRVWNCDNITISNITDVSCNKVASILLYNTTNSEIRNCNIKDSGYSGIMLYGKCQRIRIHHNYIKVASVTSYSNTYGIAISCTPESGSAGKAHECKYITVDHNYVETDLAFWEGIDAHAGSYIVVDSNFVKGFLSGISFVRLNDYTSTEDATTTHSDIINNVVIGNTNVYSGRTEEYGIRYDGNETVFAYGTIKNNVIRDIFANLGGSKGIGIELNGKGFDVSNNTFIHNVITCIRLWLAGNVNISGNDITLNGGNFIDFDRVTGAVLIDNNNMENGNNFYKITSTTGLDNVRRSNNKLVNGYWKDNTPNVTNITDFVPDYVNVSPAASNYHPAQMVAYKSQPASGSPMGWVANGTTWLAMPNLT